MAITLKLEIVTPESKVFSQDVEMVTLPGISGEMGIYPNHVPVMTQVVAGEIVVRTAGGDEYLAVGDGFVQIMADRVSVMTDMAVQADEIDEAAAEEARKRAEQRLSEKLSDEEVALVNATLARSLAQLNVKRRRHN